MSLTSGASGGPVTAQLRLGGDPVPPSLSDAITALQVEERADEPGTLLLRLPVTQSPSGDLAFVGDGTLEPFTPVSLVVAAADGNPQCLFDGYVLSWRLHLDRTVTASSIEVWAQDATWLMATTERVVEWSGLTDGEVANAVFATYGFAPAAANTDDDSPAHTEDGHTLFQRGTDLQFLQGLARRGGKVLRVACTGTPGERTGHFVAPSVDGPPAATLSMVDPTSWNVDTLDLSWDALGPTEVVGGQVDMSQSPGQAVSVTATSSAVTPMDARDYATYLAQPNSLVLTAAADVDDLNHRTSAVLTDSGFFARCTGQATADRLGTVLRVGDVVTLEGAGSLHSGNWLVWAVRSEVTTEALTMHFTLVRNAVGPPAAGGAMAVFADASAASGAP